MKAIVITRFRDKHTGEMNEPGAIIECTEERYEEIVSKRPLIKAVEDDSSDINENEDEIDLSKMTVAQLKGFAEGNEIDLGDAKTKKEILEKIDGGAE